MRGDEIVLGIDLATSNARIIAVHAATGVVVTAKSTPLSMPRGSNGGQEQEPSYLASARELVCAVTAELGARAEHVRSLSITGTSGTIVPTDDSGRPVANALMYNDNRGESALAVVRSLSDLSELAGRPYGTLGRIAWLKENTAAVRFLHSPDVVTAGLAGRILATDTSHALKIGIDPASAEWPYEALDRLGIPKTSLPELAAPGSRIGSVVHSVARELGLPLGVTIVAGMTDGCTSHLATGATRLGDTVGTLGTTLVLKGVAPLALSAPALGIYSHRAPDGNHWAGGASNTGAAMLPPLTASGNASMLEWNQLAEDHGPARQIRYPLRGVGERFPFARPGARGFTIRLGSRYGSPNLLDDYRGTLEGVAFVERLGLETLGRLGQPLGRHFVSGGASSSRVWNEIRASVLVRSLHVPTQRSSAFGAAILASAGLEHSTSFQESTSRMTATHSVQDPNVALIAPLEERYRVFIQGLIDLGYITEEPEYDRKRRN